MYINFLTFCSSGYNDSDAAPQDNLFQYIDRSNVVALNASEDGSKAIKPWHERLDETVVRNTVCEGRLSYFNNFPQMHSRWSPMLTTSCKILPSEDFCSVQ